MIYGAVEVTTTATLLVAENCERKEIILTNNNDEDVVVYIGMDANVTVDNGTPFYGNQTRGHARGFGTYLGPIWGIVANGTCDVRYWETT